VVHRPGSQRTSIFTAERQGRSRVPLSVGVSMIGVIRVQHRWPCSFGGTKGSFFGDLKAMVMIIEFYI